MIPGTKRPRSRHAAIVGTIVLGILAATVFPYRNGPLSPFSFCFVCDFRWLADGVLNVGLFLPLGMALGWGGRSFWKAALAGAALSTAIELAQLVVPGRDPSIRDIVANTLGAAFGGALVYRPRTWLAPNARQARWLLTVAFVAVGAVIICTGLLLAPSRADGSFRVSRTEADAVLQYQSRADVIGLDQPAYYAPNIFTRVELSNPVRVYVSRRRSGWCLRSGAIEHCRIGPTLGRGWSVLIYPAAAPHPWADAAIDVVWTAILFFPLGFWTTRRSLLFSLGAAIVLLGVLPFVVGLVPTTLAEWIAASVAIGAGYAVAELARRHLEVIRS